MGPLTFSQNTMSSAWRVRIIREGEMGLRKDLRNVYPSAYHINVVFGY
jgi:hypothetical protein